jgi:Uncharacterized protein conserved in bacteria
MKRFFLLTILLFTISALQSKAQNNSTIGFKSIEEYNSGAMRTQEYIPYLAHKNVGVVANQTSIIGHSHLVDTLISSGIKIKKIFTPEHGFRGSEDAGTQINNGKDQKTGIPILSLYGKNKKPTAEQMKDIDIVLFDLQDVGTRFYTYISTLTYVMESAAENNIPVVILDRPNPNGFYIDGPVLNAANQSFVGLHEVPVVYGMTIGEYGMMVNEEHWLKNSIHCELTVIPCEKYDRKCIYELPIKPSPNLPNWESIYLYPSLCFFEGSIVSIGRGTDQPFQVYGHPDMKGNFEFTPMSKIGASKPTLENLECHGENLTEYAHHFAYNKRQINLEWILNAYHQLDEESFFTPYFRLLAGTESLRKQIEEGLNAGQIRASWQNDLEKFKKTRSKYLLYEDFYDSAF